MNALAPISADQVYAWLQEVPDPEIPVLSVVDLGVVRDVSWDGDACVVVITPTYSGCPAMREITQDIQQTLARHGIDEVRVETRLAPAWTTDWMSEKGREALKGYGIAAPAIACPRCGSRDTRMVSNFGSTSCKALYRCVACREPFDYFKTH